MDSVQHISWFAAFTAGLLFFVSPCVLPLVPSYISYITGLSVEQLADAEERVMLARSQIGALALLSRRLGSQPEA